MYLTNYYKMYLQNFKYNVQRAFIFHLILDGISSILILAVKNKGVGWRGVAWRTKSIKWDESYLLAIPKKSAFSKSLIVMKCFKYVVCIFVNWTAKASLIENQEERTTWPPLPRQWQQCKFVILFKPLQYL